MTPPTAFTPVAVRGQSVSATLLEERREVTVYYCDSSALVKCYVQEQGSVWMRTLLGPTGGHHLYLASSTGVEVIAAVTRRLRRGDIAATNGAAAIAQFRQDFAQRYRLIDFTPDRPCHDLSRDP
jgi:hypothetical protein